MTGVVPMPSAHAEPAPVCTAAQLTPSLAPPENTDGVTVYPVILLNAGTAACRLSGYPAVSFIAGSDNHQVGAAAVPDQDSAGTVVIEPGQATSANVGIADAGNFPPDCDLVPASGLQLTLPDQADPMIIGHAGAACAGTGYPLLHVGPFTGA